MTSRLRRMRPYHPRKRSPKQAPQGHPHNNGLKKQILHDLKHKISADVNTLIVMIESGNSSEVSLATQRAKNDFLKYSSEMRSIAQKLGERYAKAVRDYLDSVDTIVHSNPISIDKEKIHRCYTMTEKLEQTLSAA